MSLFLSLYIYLYVYIYIDVCKTPPSTLDEKKERERVVRGERKERNAGLEEEIDGSDLPSRLLKLVRVGDQHLH